MYECCQCTGIEKIFNAKTARKEIRRYEKHGPRKTTRWLIDCVRKNIRQGGSSLIDIGGGIGAIQYELLKYGVTQVNSIDASSSYHDLASQMAEKRGVGDKIQRTHGDFTDDSIRPDMADIVTLDRVICCYPDMKTLVEKSSGLATRVYAVVFPRERFFIKWSLPLVHWTLKLRRIPFRVYVHSTNDVDAIVRQNGFRLLQVRHSFIWQVRVYEKETRE
ncbi:MAG: methyltransferase domain-containing protein [Candidatus Marinimicrobia bacterium]|nr:methyltransferase domain-containing protein [Candidatus Neomarinimicrobiota bacterium]